MAAGQLWPFLLSPGCLEWKAAPAGREGTAMDRMYIDCREIPSDTKCTVAIAADSERELLEAAVQHAVAVHGHSDTPELREQIASAIKHGTPPVEAPTQRPMSEAL